MKHTECKECKLREGDCGAHLLECPSCKSRIVLNAFTYAVGCLGYAFCPYCGFDVREKEVKNYEDSQL